MVYRLLVQHVFNFVTKSEEVIFVWLHEIPVIVRRFRGSILSRKQFFKILEQTRRDILD